jgi:uncharacterized membrane protein
VDSEHAANSELLRRITATDDDHMPPRRAARQLTEAEKQLMRAWIEEGARWSGHWAFEPISRPRCRS